MRAAIYARYSSDLQSTSSIEDQVRLCRERIGTEGWTLVQTYADRAMSGASLLRSGLQGLLEDAMAARIDLVVAEALDRLSRDQADIAALHKRLTFAGVQIVTLAEGEITELHVGLKGTMNQLFLKDLADKTRRGLRGRIEAGKSGGGRCYGYRLGTNVGEREIDPQEADVVRRIFRDYAAGRSPRAIAKALNAERVPGPSGKAWGASTIHGNPKRGTGILNNELYVGRLVWNRLRYVKDPETGKRVSRPNPENAWVIHDVPELRLVDDDLWRAVKARQTSAALGSREPAGFWDRRRPKNLLSGLVTCGVCGGGVIQVGKDYLGCAAQRNKGTCTNRRLVKRDRLEAAVLDGLKDRLMAPDLMQAFCEEYVAEINRLRRSRIDASANVRQELAKIEKDLRNIVEAVKAGLFNPTMKAEMDALEGRKAKLVAELETTDQPSNADPILHPALADVYREKVGRLRESLDDPSLRAEAADALRGLIEQIVLTPEAKGRGSTAVLEGDLAKLLFFAATPGRTARAVGGSCSTNLVAGAGFEPATFRL